MKVSLQQAYTLLTRGKVTLLKYKVYASLSRLGYRVFRHPLIESDKNVITNKEIQASNDEIKENVNVEFMDSLNVDKNEVNSENCEIKEENNKESKLFNQESSSLFI